MATPRDRLQTPGRRPDTAPRLSRPGILLPGEQRTVPATPKTAGQTFRAFAIAAAPARILDYFARAIPMPLLQRLPTPEPVPASTRHQPTAEQPPPTWQ